MGLTAHPPITSIDCPIDIFAHQSFRGQREGRKPHTLKGREWHRSSTAPTPIADRRRSANMLRHSGHCSMRRNTPCCQTCTWRTYTRLDTANHGWLLSAARLAMSCISCCHWTWCLKQLHLRHLEQGCPKRRRASGWLRNRGWVRGGVPRSDSSTLCA